MNELALFAGTGGGILGGILSGFRTVCAVETNKYCQAVLLQRQADKILPYFPIWDDVRTFDGTKWRGVVDIITAGFPCQPFSLAGKRQQENDERNMWPDTIRIIREVRPRFILLENVPGLLSSGYYQRIFAEIAEAGYLFRWEIISAADVGAPHLRKRLWITGVLSNTNNQRLERYGISKVENQGKRGQNADLVRPTWWDTEPGLGRVAHGIPNRVDRIKALGNAIVPQVAYQIIRNIAFLEMSARCHATDLSG